MTTWKLFGFEIKKSEPEKKLEDQKQESFAVPQYDDGAVILQSGAHYGTYVDLEGFSRNEVELITKYREMAMQPEMEAAIDDIIDEAISPPDTGMVVDINLDELEVDDEIKNKIIEEFKIILRLLNFKNYSHDIFRRWYVDGRIFYHVIINEEYPRLGIQELRYIDPRRIRKVREIQRRKDLRTGADIVGDVKEYYSYNQFGVIGPQTNMGVKISTDSVININSGLMDARRAMVLSYLHKAIKPLNQVRMLEDAVVIYTLARAPQRRIFYVDVGNLPKNKAEAYLKSIMNQYRNKLVYDSSTGEMRDDRKHLSMLEDFWFPRREGNKASEITTLQGDTSLINPEILKYFEKKLYKALGVPVSRLESEQGFSLGRASEITRDELKFTKFVQRLRSKFSTIFDEILRVQLVLKGVCTESEWNDFRQYIWYNYKKDNNFNELKEAELLTNRATVLAQIDPYVGKYYSLEYVNKNILRLSETEAEEMQKQMKKEQKKYEELGIGPYSMNNPIVQSAADAAFNASADANSAPTAAATESTANEPIDKKIERDLFKKNKIKESRMEIIKTVITEQKDKL